MKKAKIKKDKKVMLASVATIALSMAITLTTIGCEVNSKKYDLEPSKPEVSQAEVITQEVTTPKPKFVPKQTDLIATWPRQRSLEQLQYAKVPTYTTTFKDDDGVKREYEFVEEEDLLQISRELSVAIKDYFKAHGASDWSNPDEERFWPENIEYIVVAIAFAESSYRTNYINDIQCGGLTGLHKESLLKSLNGWANNTEVWGEDIPYINCNPDEVDIFNPITCMEYTYYNIGYVLANRLKKNKSFVDDNGCKQSIWKHTPYSDEVQTDLVIANNLWGIDNIETAGLGINKDGYTVEYFRNSEYVNKVLNKTNELINTYENSLSR